MTHDLLDHTATDDRTATDVRSDEDVVRYADLHPFRAATHEELVNHTNPYRRPVRPDDLSFLRFETPLRREEASALKSLIGHRILLNALEGELSFVEPAGVDVTADKKAYQATGSLELARRVQGTLSDLLLRPLAAWADEDITDLDRFVAQRAAAEQVLLETVRSADDPRYALQYMLMQESCTRPLWKVLFARLVQADQPRLAPETHTLIAQASVAAQREDQLADLGDFLELSAATRAYWQFYLPQSLATATHCLAAVSGLYDHQQALGVVAAHALAQHLRDRTLRALAEDLGWVCSAAGAELGDGAVALLAGAEPRSFALVAAMSTTTDDELRVQLGWADDLALYHAKAEQLQRWIDDEHMDIDLDTFVESDEETSTTHVHDDHRLVVVAEGWMEFWNNTGRVIRMDAGDKLLIPQGRLHGSVVRSGQCTYHQPVIPDHMMRAIGITADQVTPASY